MKKILHRLRNLWRLSSAIVVEKDASPNSIHIATKIYRGEEQPKKMAQIIKRKSEKQIINNVLNNE